MKMNRITNWLKGCAVVCGMAWCCLSCEHDYLKYDTQMRDALYFVWPDTSYCSFTAGDPVDTMDYKIYVQVMGLPRGSERSYKIEIIDTNTTAVEGVHYKLSENQIFPADTVKAQMHVILYNRDPELRNQPVTLAFRLVSSEDFDVVPVEQGGLMCHLIIKTVPVEMPGLWIWGGTTYLGPYSEQLYFMFKKFYHKVEETNPTLYNRWEKTYGSELSRFYFMRHWSVEKIPMSKYLLRPLYDYFQENPDPEVKMPEPMF